eukprot:TRINITY_DN882_c0_g1_i3.p1 TRINITY_DN882_c0_g1~~TRINITY_DN882_c0_g1_i3.p1  ORF type:complete len:461 (+),score=118.16 TRINITY_DN882_c0_g1_i3:115-1497(+)
MAGAPPPPRRLRQFAALLAAALAPGGAAGRECSDPASPAETFPAGQNIPGSGVAVRTVEDCVQLCTADCSCVAGMLMLRRLGGLPWRPMEPVSAAAEGKQRVPTGVGKLGFVCWLRRGPVRVRRLPPARGLGPEGQQVGPWAFMCNPCTRFPGMPKKSDADERWADGCQHVYLDVGSNSGVQIRKLYEPEMYPLSAVFPIFARYFGKDRGAWKDVCTFGFEPNPARAARLKRIEALYRGRGHRVKIFTHTAVGIKDGSSVYYQNSDRGPQLGGALWRRSTGGGSHIIRIVDLSRWLLRHVAARRLPESASKKLSWPFVVAKIDIEGYEWLLIPEMLRTRAICSIQSLFVEYHGSSDQFKQRLVVTDPELAGRIPVNTQANLTRAVAAAGKSAGCNVALQSVDDESYAFESFGKMDQMGWYGGSSAAERQLPPVHVLLSPAELQAEADAVVAGGAKDQALP